MKIMQLKSNSKHQHRALTKTVLALTAVLFSPLVFSNSFVFPNTVSMERSTLAESFVDSNLVKSVGLREESSLAGFVKASILSPQRNLNGTVANALVLTKISADGKHARYSQRFNGYEVFGGEVIAHLDRKGISLDQVTGNFITGLEGVSIAKKATLKQDQAIGKARKMMDQSHQWDYQNEDANLVVYHNPDIEGFEPTLAYVINFLAVSESADPSRPFIVVDAKTGDILDRWEGLNT